MNLTKLSVALDMSRTIMDGAIQNFQRDGYLAMAAFLFGTRVDANTGAVLIQPGYNIVASPDPIQSQEDKDIYVERLAELARRTRAAGVGIMAEAWNATVAPENKHRIVAGKVHELPGAKEIAYFLLEHRDLPGPSHTRTWVADIHRPVTGNPVLGPFRLIPGNGINFGRFSRLLGTS